MTITAHLSYLQKQAFCPLQIETAPHKDLGMVVVIPCHNEPDLNSSLEALWNCARPEGSVEVIVVINSGVQHIEAVKARNALSLEEGRQWAALHSEDGFRVHFLYFPELPKKHAGVGLARKIGMDEAVGRLEAVGRASAPIVCFDADADCDPNYLQAIESHFREHPKTPACSIHYEHPLEGELPAENYAGILRYELYLRYYVEALRFAGHPHAFHTIGSSMAVRSAAYQAQGGMNRRKAGEDFHFLQKMIPLGNFSEIRNTRVIPSPRMSDRVPFGTGKAISDWVAQPDMDYPVYAPEIFGVLKSFLDQVKAGYGKEGDTISKGMPEGMQKYLEKVDFAGNWQAIGQQTTSEKMFFKRFFRWFNGLEVLHCVHFLQNSYYPDQPVVMAAGGLLEKCGQPSPPEVGRGLLDFYRIIQRGGQLQAEP